MNFIYLLKIIGTTNNNNIELLYAYYVKHTQFSGNKSISLSSNHNKQNE